MTKKTRRTFSPDFKREAVKLLERGEKEAAQIARELGIPRNRLYKWKEQLDKHGAEAFPGKPGRRPNSGADEVAALKAENKRLQEENEILKKAAKYFARELP